MLDVLEQRRDTNGVLCRGTTEAGRVVPSHAPMGRAQCVCGDLLGSEAYRHPSGEMDMTVSLVRHSGQGASGRHGNAEGTWSTNRWGVPRAGQCKVLMIMAYDRYVLVCLRSGRRCKRIAEALWPQALVVVVDTAWAGIG